MDSLKTSVKYWEIVHHLVLKEDFRVIHMNIEEDIVWLEDDRKKPGLIIRLANRTFDWSNELRADSKRVFEASKQIRKQINLKQANVVSVVFSALAPVDSYEDVTSRALPFTAGGKNQFRTILIPMEEIDHRLFPLATEWNLRDMPTFLPDTNLETEEDQYQLRQTLRQLVKRMFTESREKERELFFHSKPRVTYALLGIIIALFIYIESQGSTMSTSTLVEFGAKFDPLILEGEWWRFFSAMFLHIGMLHLFMNSLALFYLGSAVERIFGSSRFIIVYILAGLFGSVSSFVFNDNVSAGASGAIFGCFGALLYFGIRHRRIFFRTMGSSVLVILAINLAFGFFVPMVDNAAHVGGLLGGFAASAIVGLPRQSKPTSQLIFTLGTFAALVALLLFGFNQSVESEQTMAIYYELGRESIEDDRLTDAIGYLSEVTDGSDQLDGEIITGQILANAYFLLSYAQINVADYEDAEQNLLEAIELNPEFHEAYFNLSLLLIEQNRLEEALGRVEQAQEISTNESYEEVRRQIEDMLQE
ncbi:rhomboid family intramembrane serine protease [Paenalkalicoccus suaedae]|uniref:Rhomboid family intramembrane serine protease n=1 Tax=Paenalkalicoccus suaedae TaxID=2592382 RepID=A0A859FCX5_9BACI|nr:rhomboid family intramembrane serine protease [Paenalkalicoccus suaedae]QKS70917.1 rhomboid family intramembrane serine protease [Paenalkalicoccus suaedae]